MRINPEISRKYQGVYPKEENNMKKKRLFALILSLVMIFTLALPMGGYAEEYFFPEDEFVIDDGGDVWLEEYIEEPVEDYWADEDFLLEDEYTEEPDQFFEDPEFFEENVFEESDELLAVDPNENESEEFILFDAETFDAAELTVTDPEPQTVAEGETATFHVEVSGGTEPYTYQWAAKVGNKWYNSSLNGYNTDTLSFEAVKAWSGRTYRCTVTDSTGTVKTASATLTVESSTIVAEPFVFKKIEGTNNLALIGYTGTDSSITVPGSVNSMTVTEIGVSPLGDGEKGVFEDNTILTSITLPNSITAIRERAFKGCTNLSTMTTY